MSCLQIVFRQNCIHDVISAISALHNKMHKHIAHDRQTALGLLQKHIWIWIICYSRLRLYLNSELFNKQSQSQLQSQSLVRTHEITHFKSIVHRALCTVPPVLVTWIDCRLCKLCIGMCLTLFTFRVKLEKFQRTKWNWIMELLLSSWFGIFGMNISDSDCVNLKEQIFYSSRKLGMGKRKA